MRQVRCHDVSKQVLTKGSQARVRDMTAGMFGGTHGAQTGSMTRGMTGDPSGGNMWGHEWEHDSVNKQRAGLRGRTERRGGA